MRRNLSGFFYKKLKPIWIVFSILLFLFFSYFNLQNNINTTQIKVYNHANMIISKLDELIRSVYMDIGLPSYTKKNLDCERDFMPFLHHIILNHPRISGIAILDPQRHLICSTFSNHESFYLKNSQSLPAINGPLRIDNFDNPIFSLKKKVNNYTVEVIITQPIFLNTLQTKLAFSGVQEISLYNELTNKMLLAMEPKIDYYWTSDAIFNYIFNDFNKTFLIRAHSTTIPGVSVRVGHQCLVTVNSFLISEFLLLLDILVFAISSYYLLKNALKLHASLLWSIKKALKNDRFFPVYQPLFNTELCRYSGVEVLLRWKTNTNEIIMPDYFIQEAEDTGLIIPITVRIIESTFLDLQQMVKSDPLFHVSFNLCALHFTDANFFNDFYSLIEKFKIPPNQVLLEITERELLDQENTVYLERMLELRKIGYSLAIDDYGTGHASINYLQAYPFNYLKIDKLFIKAIGTKAITESLNDAIIDLAKRINLIIIAEGVETKEQVDYLLKNKIQLLQGWYFSKELNAENLRHLLQGGKK